jgi:hypothetical protein
VGEAGARQADLSSRADAYGWGGGRGGLRCVCVWGGGGGGLNWGSWGACSLPVTSITPSTPIYSVSAADQPHRSGFNAWRRLFDDNGERRPVPAGGAVGTASRASSAN